MKTGAAYIRVSTEEQMEFSPDSQLKKIREYAASRGISLPEQYIFLDEGISGRSAKKRPAFQRMICMAKGKPRPFEVILVWKFSRFARNRQDSILYKSMLRKECGIDVVSITEQLSDDPTAILVEALLEAMDEYYSINLAQEVKRGMNEKFSRGGVVSGPPFGYRMGEEVFLVDDENAPFVSMIFRDFLEGKSYRQIAVKLNDMGVRSIRGNPFESRSVEYILSNPVYIGQLRRSPDGTDSADRFHRGENVRMTEGGHEPLIDPETFAQAQRQMEQVRRARGKYGRSTQAGYLLRGLVRCSCCGGTLTLTEKGKSLQCCRYARGQCRESHQVRLDKISCAVLGQLKEDLGDLVLEGTVKPVKVSVQGKVERVLLEKERRRLERARAAYEDGVDTLEEYRQAKVEIGERIRRLSQQMKGAEQNALTPAEAEPDVAESFEAAFPVTSEAEPTVTVRHLVYGEHTASVENGQSFRKFRIPFRELLDKLEDSGLEESGKNEILRSFVSKIVFSRKTGTIEIYYHV